MREGNSFSLFCQFTPGGAPSPSHNTSTGPMSFWGYPSEWSQVPSQGVPQPGTDGRGTTATSGWGAGYPGMGSYPRIGYIRDRTAYEVLDTRRAIRLLQF